MGFGEPVISIEDAIRFDLVLDAHLHVQEYVILGLCLYLHVERLNPQANVSGYMLAKDTTQKLKAGGGLTPELATAFHHAHRTLWD